MRTQFLKSYSFVSQLIRRIEADDISLDDLPMHKQNYLAGATFCGNTVIIVNHEATDSPYFYAKSGLYKTFNGLQNFQATEMDDGVYVLADGTLLALEWDTTHFTDNSHKWIHIDINGYKNGPNRFGIDFFTFQVIDRKVKTMGDDGTFCDDKEKCCSETSGDARNSLDCVHYAKSRHFIF